MAKAKPRATRSFDRVEFKSVNTNEVIFTLDMDKTCPRCGKAGASDRGVCLNCGIKNANKLKRALEDALNGGRAKRGNQRT